jgi:hypothetical protein
MVSVFLVRNLVLSDEPGIFLLHLFHPLPPEYVESRRDDQGCSGPEAVRRREVAPDEVAQQGGPEEG